MQKKNRPLYAIRIDPDGRMRYVNISLETKWDDIKRNLGATVTRQVSAGGFSGVNRILVYNYYATESRGINAVAMRLSGEKQKIYGPALLFRENHLGYPTLMSEGAAYKMRLEVERGW